MILSAEEKKLKNFWISNPNLDMSHFYELKDVLPILSDVFGSSEIVRTFSEEIFILGDLDCAFVRHLRYLPAFFHNHEFFEITYVQSGTCVNRIGNIVLNMREGDYCFHAPGTIHAIGAFSEDDIIFNIVIRRSTFERYFFDLFSDNDILSSFFRHVLYNSEDFPYLIFHTGADYELSSIVTRAHNEFGGNTRFRRQMLNALLSEFFATLLRNHEKDVDIPDKSDLLKSNLVFILHYMEEHFDTITLKELSAFFGYSERQMERIITKVTGSSFRDIIQSTRIRKAKEMLKNRDLSIEQISVSVGYNSTNSFRKIFERLTGMTPREYRDTH